MFIRYLQNKLPEASFFLFGPRQVGKSTLLHSEKSHLTIDLLDPEIQLSYNKNPNLLRQQLDDLAPGENHKILIDEIQRVPKLLVNQPLRLSFARVLPPHRLLQEL